jgi:2-polyprenyl-3-methyl-5-hydroxy-6-metoxy-1,4-benzoquinol methylase
LWRGQESATLRQTTGHFILEPFTLIPYLSQLARRKKVEYFFGPLDRSLNILEVGCAEMWLKQSLLNLGFKNYTGIDLRPPADIVGDIRFWRELGLSPASFDVIAAFEVVEHIDCFSELRDLLSPTGYLFLPSPVPHMDWACKLFEAVGLNQKRTSPHDYLIYFKDIQLFDPIELRTIGLMAQWGKFRKAEPKFRYELDEQPLPLSE